MNPPGSSYKNRILSALPKAEISRLAPRLSRVTLKQEQTLSNGGFSEIREEMRQRANPNVLKRAEALRQKASDLHMKALEKAEFANRTRQRAARLLLAVSATQRKTLKSGAPNPSGVKFLKVDLDVALNFAKVALHSHSDHDKRARNQANARKAHDAVIQWKNRLEISRRDALELDAKLRKLRAAFRKLGERL